MVVISLFTEILDNLVNISIELLFQLFYKIL